MQQRGRAKSGRNEQAIAGPRGPILSTEVKLDRLSDEPLYRQIEARIRMAILDGTLPPGARLPSSRSLARQLGIARTTVEQAYSSLAGEGYVEGKAAAGTVVASGLEPARLRQLSTRERQAQAIVPPFDPPLAARPFQPGLPSFDAFPRKLWTRLAARAARNLSPATMTYQDSRGLPDLRREVMRYVAVARGVACGLDEVFITSGFQGALGLIAAALLTPGDRVWIEDPGYWLGREALTLANGRLVPVPVDGDGLDVGAGMARAGGARFALVTPTNQSPLGVTLSQSRRNALMAWAGAAQAWVIEDDYDSEFRYRGPPMPALKSIDRDGRVLFIGSFSKMLFPGLRLGYLIVPAALAERFARVAAWLKPQAGIIEQMTVAAFMAEGHFARHIARMGGLYAQRRTALVAALRALPGGGLPVEVEAGGMHVLVRMPGRDDKAIAELARINGLPVEPLSRFAVEADIAPGLLLSFTNLPVEAAEREVGKLYRLLTA